MTMHNLPMKHRPPVVPVLPLPLVPLMESPPLPPSVIQMMMIITMMIIPLQITILMDRGQRHLVLLLALLMDLPQQRHLVPLPALLMEYLQRPLLIVRIIARLRPIMGLLLLLHKVLLRPWVGLMGHHWLSLNLRL